MRRMVLAVAIGVALVGALLLYAVVSTLDTLVARAIESYGSAMTGTAVRVGSVNIDLAEGSGTIRGLTGIVQFLPAMVLLPFETDLEPLMDPVDRAPALVEFDFELFPIKFGIDYTSAEF